MEPKDKDQLIKESITVRGICSAIQSMSMPTIRNLIELLNKAGFRIKLINKEEFKDKI